MIRLKSADHDSANNTDSAALVNDLAAAEDAFLADMTNEANSLVASVYSFEKSGVASLKTKTKNADATLLGLVISNLASLDGVIAGLVNTFNTIEAGAWKTYTDAAAVGFTPPGTLCQPCRKRTFKIDSSLRRFESSQCDQHRLRQLFSTGLLEHVDDLRHSV